ncbi:hypothetical protein TVAG_079510 [Trichomonas vaginalis G3]|uniref:Uncharacterized protein n=1 Tax=Trichomonas vaginalis (strain ATCC PRA-98 / G3) TaxID=412133 RepID=A2EF83_TRIV3|nr:nuclear chaperone required for maturation and nuclear export of pre-60s ribosome subunits [Trichomonas vaginalis G3]EAY08693.1 hypothetical protein TVAG_079510 [Trichomonas vaginalis G3]KAI5492820.1 nuclear chaperone required for maturation and nuclear export of pre-60s ribosome subunits [Trichomonas vaginalis G3]|eukprot:XP_001320916.1 hypothetical protein [Trichomonas vaginalis G3]
MAFRDCGFPITIILATSEGPVAVCINKIDKEIFKENSPVLTEIYRCLDSSHGACSFSQALTAAYNIRCSQQEQESILIAITNAHFNQIESDAVVTCLSYLQLVKTYSIGVGVGISPIMISKVFNRSIWSGNPLKIGNCFMKLSELDTNKVITEGKITNPYPLNKYSIEDIYNMFINNNRKYFTELTIGLDDIKMYDAAADHYMIEGTDLVHLPTEEENEYGPYQGEIPEVDLGRNKKWNYNILICQLYDFTCNSMDVTKETSNAQNQQAGTQNQQAGRSNKQAGRSNKPA